MLSGAPRVHAELRAEGRAVGKKRIARLMRAARIVGVSRRRGIVTTRRDRDARPAPDPVDRNFTANRPNQLWVADITYIPTAAGFLYLAAVLDALSRRIVGWAMETHLRTELVLSALEMAIGQRKPSDVIHHSDRGSQYTALAFGGRCREAGVRPSMGSVGDAYDNAMCELLRYPGMRAVGTPPVHIADRGQDGGLQLYRRLVQPRSPPFRHPLSIPNRLRDADEGDPNDLTDKPSTKIGSTPVRSSGRRRMSQAE